MLTFNLAHVAHSSAQGCGAASPGEVGKYTILGNFWASFFGFGSLYDAGPRYKLSFFTGFV